MKEKIRQRNWHKIKPVVFGLAALFLILLNITTSHSRQPQPSLVRKDLSRRETLKDSLDTKTGLIIAPGFAVVSTTCVRCHSPKLITEKRATREGWLATIRWMQQTQGLWDLGKDESVILDYLAKNYAPKNEGRRPLLKTPEWYKLTNRQ
ncbi:monoheme cytochrome C [Adhaeribacter arboris]|uniref:Monoheme cytochrome C n=1 Tax=Adhaeribacter arboris TaxID=2072846 RepID=A0A2T2YIU5_9BACT|nr:monoheme cytochrome C [Adhaeribacter arboris]PSR55433.1 monoheme cytochrome C [Adhaeribacter arboris]